MNIFRFKLLTYSAIKNFMSIFILWIKISLLILFICFLYYSCFLLVLKISLLVSSYFVIVLKQFYSVKICQNSDFLREKYHQNEGKLRKTQGFFFSLWHFVWTLLENKLWKARWDLDFRRNQKYFRYEKGKVKWISQHCYYVLIYIRLYNLLPLDCLTRRVILLPQAARSLQKHNVASYLKVSVKRLHKARDLMLKYL